MDLGRIVALFADVHGAEGTLRRALELCRDESVETVALLGDLFDRVEQADPVVEVLAGWDVVGVYGNHEREVALAAASGEVVLQPATLRLLSGLREQVVIDEVCLIHEEGAWVHHDPVASLFGRVSGRNGRHDPHVHVHVTFAGHTHYRSAWDERGPIDLAREVLRLHWGRRYLINPGALAAGQFAIWDREERTVWFRHLVR
ncbi:MAG TPA: metallophosphoesterase family protein [Thermomicrobiaceae bacterium]|nr:metallophosphoesterase family protein [Thermomicrobiaceae bacterium]